MNPLSPAEMVIDHSVIADLFGRPDAIERNVEIEYQRNGDTLRARFSGDNSALDTLVACWMALAEELRRDPPAADPRAFIRDVTEQTVQQTLASASTSGELVGLAEELGKAIRKLRL